MEVKLIEYHWTGSSYSTTPSNTFTFPVEPSSIDKNAFCEWRLAHRGFRKPLKKVKWRYRRTEQFKLKGILKTETDRRQLEAIATRNSHYRIEVSQEETSVMLSMKSEGGMEGSYYSPSEYETNAYYIISKYRASSVPGKTYYQYDLELERTRFNG